MKLVLPWLREFADIRAEAGAVAEALALRGFEVASIEARPEPVIDFDITANRPDCLSVIGLAREAATAFEVEFKDLLASGAAPPADALPARGPGPPASRDANLEVDIEDPDLCPRYAAQVFRVKIGPSPDWIARRLHAAGVRPINTIVDATNYVMLERGHPTHAFDLERLAGRALRIRRARKGERLRTLDGVDRALEPDMLVIADAERPQAIGGVMGGADSEVTPTTATVALESAWFLPRSVRRTAKTLELRTEASMRFERGADIEGPLAAIRRVGELLAKMGAGEPIGAPIDRYPSPRLPLRLTLRRPQIARLLGADVPANDVVRILTGLGFGVRPHFERPQTPGFDESVFERSKWGLTPSDGWLVTVPSWRVDATREADLIEEIARHYGYDRLPTTFPPLDAVAAPPDPRIARDALVRQALGGAGFAEAVTFTFIERGAAEPFDPAGGLVAIANPLSETFAVIRPSLVPGLVDAAAHNRRRERRDVRLFEIGTAFSATDGESRRVGLVWTGAAAPEHWSGPGRAVDFSDMRGAVERVADALGAGVAIERAAVSWLVPGRAASIALAVGGPEPGLRVGVVGQLRPSIAEARGVPGGDDIYVAEIDLERLAAAASAHDDLRVAPLPRHPSIVRDLSILVADTLPAAAVRGTIRAAAPRLLESIAEFDRYQGQGVPDGQVSLSFHLTFRAPDRTLTDEEVDRAMAAIVAALEREHGARRR